MELPPLQEAAALHPVDLGALVRKGLASFPKSLVLVSAQGVEVGGGQRHLRRGHIWEQGMGRGRGRHHRSVCGEDMGVRQRAQWAM
eukprot:scaffold9963_cov80-Isochrysis_galbana.AAC.1